MFDFLKKAITNTYEKIKETLGGNTQELDLKAIEQTLIQQNFTSELTTLLLKKIEENNTIPWQETTRKELFSLFEKTHQPIENPDVIILLGINGSGKTTSAIKLAREEKKSQKTLLVPADTFRAAAQEQLHSLALDYHIDFFQHNLQNPTSVIYESAQYTKKHDYQKIIIDTAGRIHQNHALLKELQKTIETAKKQFQPKKIATYIVLDGLQGKNLSQQVKEFLGATPIDGIILTKLDGQVRPGIICSIVHTFHIPVIYLSFGQKEIDLTPFNVNHFIESLI
jgi:fused signal recognition particle receptor